MDSIDKTVWIISPSFPPMVCGVGDHTTKLVRELARLKPTWQWHILTTCPTATGEAPASPVAEANIDIHPNVRQWKNPDLPMAVQPMVRDHPPSIVLMQYTPHLYHRLGVNLDICTMVKQFSQEGVAVHLLIHEMYVPFDGSLRHYITGPVQRYMMRQLLKHCRYAFISTAEWQEELQKRYPQEKHKIVTLPVSSNIDEAACPETVKQELRSTWCKTPDETLLLFWGKLHPSKQLPWTLTALQRLQESDIPFQVLYIGPDWQTLQQALTTNYASLEDRVHITGVLPEAKISQYLQTVDLLLYPLEDGASTRRGAFMAAMQHGTPTVTTKGKATDETLAHCPNIFWSNSAETFNQAVLQQVLSHTQNDPNRSDRQKNFFQTHYSWQTIAKDLLTRLNNR